VSALEAYEMEKLSRGITTLRVDDAGTMIGLADAAIAELEAEADTIHRAYDECSKERQVAELEAAFWKWLATHEYRCPLGEMNPGEEGSYLVEVTYTVEFLAHMRERWEREARP
jgi:hypothetical protein